MLCNGQINGCFAKCSDGDSVAMVFEQVGQKPEIKLIVLNNKDTPRGARLPRLVA